MTTETGLTLTVTLPDVLVRDFLGWVMATGEHHGREWEPMVDILNSAPTDSERIEPGAEAGRRGGRQAGAMEANEALLAAREWSLDEMDADEVIDVLAAEVESLRAAVGRVREVCTADRRIRWDDGSSSISVLDPADVLRALDGET